MAPFFERSIDPQKIIELLSFHKGIKISPKSTLIIIDEVQECARALNSLKYFEEEAGEYHLAAAGSLLGIKTKKDHGFSVGKVNFLHMHPLTYFEFLNAQG